MQRRSGCRAEPRDIAGVGRNFGLNQRDIKWGIGPGERQFMTAAVVVIHAVPNYAANQRKEKILFNWQSIIFIAYQEVFH